MSAYPFWPPCHPTQLVEMGVYANTKGEPGPNHEDYFIRACANRALTAYETAYAGRSPHSAEELDAFVRSAVRERRINPVVLFHERPSVFASAIRDLGRRHIMARGRPGDGAGHIGDNRSEGAWT